LSEYFSNRASARFALVAGALLLAAMMIGQPALAATINYGDHMGTTVTYVDVTESSGTDAVPLFGPPTVTGDSIDFNPVGFDAASAGGGADITDGQLTFMVEAKPGANGMVGISFSEAGITQLAGNVAAGDLSTATMVRAAGVLDVHEVDFVPINHISVPFFLTFNPSNGDYFLGTDGGGGPLYFTDWSGGANINLLQVLFDNGIRRTFGVTKLSVNLDNVLVATSQNGTSSLISKKDFGGLTITVQTPGGGGGPDIPEPTTLVLVGLSVAGLTVGRRRVVG
jgi:hypothetical protein